MTILQVTAPKAINGKQTSLLRIGNTRRNLDLRIPAIVGRSLTSPHW